MSLGGIAIAIGAMVDAAVVMIENAHKRLEAWQHAHPDARIPEAERWREVGEAAVEVGPALFFSLLVITLSFVPVFALEAQEGRLFSPLAYTKTYAMAASAGLAVTLVPVLMGYLIRGRIPDERKNPLNRLLIAAYRPLLALVLRAPWTTLLVALLALAATAYPIARIGGEFMPPLYEGDLLYMPSALPGLSAGKAAEILQQTDKLIATVPEVKRVFGKIGRAETATDPAPLEMVETTVQLKPRSEWRPGMTPEKLVEELDRLLQLPGLSNIWVPPIRNRIDMLATGIKSPLGIKVSGNDLAEIEKIAGSIERVVKEVQGVTSALAERVAGGRYIDVKVDRGAASRYGMNVAEVHSVVTSAIGGETIGETIEGRRRFPISVRYPRELRDSVADLKALPFVADSGAQLTLGAVADIGISDGPPMLRSENARLSGWIYVDIRGRDLVSVVTDAQRAVSEKVRLPPGVSVAWSGQFEYLERRAEAAGGGGAVHAAHHLRPALSHFPPRRRSAPHHGDAAVFARGRVLAHLGARPQPLDRRRDRLHRARGSRGGIRRGDAALPETGDRAARPGAHPGSTPGSARRGRGAAGAPESDDRSSDTRRSHAAAPERGHRRGSHAADRRAHDRRHDHRPAALDVRDPRGLPADPWAARVRGRFAVTRARLAVSGGDQLVQNAALAGFVAGVASFSKLGQLAFQRAHRFKPRPHPHKLILDQAIDVAAVLPRPLHELEQSANIGQRDIEGPAVTDKGEPLELALAVGTVAVRLPLRWRKQPLPLVIADGLNVHAGRCGQFPDTHEGLHSGRFILPLDPGAATTFQIAPWFHHARNAHERA